MEVNKGEAERCRDIGTDASRNGQYSKAVKFLTKSQKLYPLPGVTSLLSQAQRKLNNESMNGNSPSGATGASASASASSAGSSNRNGNSNAGYSNMNGTSTRSSNSSDYQRSNSTTSNASSSNNSNASFRHPSQRQSTTASAPSSSASSSSTPSASASSARTGTDGRTYTPAQEKLVQQILKSKEGGRGAHYRVLGIESNADENAIKKAYRKAALKLHPDKNSAPQADDAFKAVGLAYATLSDSQKRTIYDRYGEEDPDNTGGGMGRRGGGGVHFNGQNMNPEDIFNAFFGGGGGGMPGGGGMHFRAGGMPGGFRVYSTNGGFGGMPRGGMPGQRGQQQQRQEPQNPIMQLVQLLPILMLVLMSFFNLPGEQANGKTGGNQYFSLTYAPPYSNQMKTKLATVKEIPFYVTDKFSRTYARDRYQLGQVEMMVEKSYKNYLINECKNQKTYKNNLVQQTRNRKGLTDADRQRQMKKADEFELSRCLELKELFGSN